MALQFSTTVRNAELDVIESTVGTGPLLQIFTGSAANCAAADSGTKLVEITLPSDWMAAASSGTKAKSGTWSGTAVATGTAAQFRVKDSGGSTCHMQGTVALGSGDLSLDNTSIASGQAVTISTATLTAGNS